MASSSVRSSGQGEGGLPGIQIVGIGLNSLMVFNLIGSKWEFSDMGLKDAAILEDSPIEILRRRFISCLAVLEIPPAFGVRLSPDLLEPRGKGSELVDVVDAHLNEGCDSEVVGTVTEGVFEGHGKVLS